MRFTGLAAVASALLGFASALKLPALKTFERNTIFTPPTNYTDPRTLYPRTVQLQDGRLLATWENYSPEPPLVWYPIVESLDGGVSWKEVGQIHDQVNGWGMRYQPFLYELRQNFGRFKTGTILCAGNSIPTDLSKTKIDLYASTDKGRTWKFVSSVVEGGVALPNNGETPVWEPFILIHDNTLIVYFADQRSSEHGQEISHKETRDLIHWSNTVTDVSFPTYDMRPGMPVVAKLPTGDYIYVYEWGGSTQVSGYQFPIFFRISKDPRKFAQAEDHFVGATNTATIGNSSPNVVWTPVGGKNGTIIISSSRKYVYASTKLGAEGSWVAYDVPEAAAYTRNLRLMQQDPNYLLIMGAGVLPPSTTNKVTVSMVKVSELLKNPVIE